jgi:L-asparaginase II
MKRDAEHANPVAVLVWRGERIESRHRVAFAAADSSGALVHGQGDLSEAVFPRSAVKPLQALAMLESGAADRFALTPAEIALACASHSGEPRQVSAVEAWLGKLGLGADALECGAHPPSYGPAAEQLARRGEPPSPLHNNCSGKHAGMLTLACHLDVPTAGYALPGHPVQQRIAAILAEMAGAGPLPSPAIDGCSVPTFPLTLPQLATAMARLADPAALRPELAAACRRVQSAMREHPYMVGGSGRACTAIMTALPKVLVKTGAEGVYAAALPARELGIALKVEDGAGRAAPVALLALLDALGAIDEPARTALEELARPKLRNHTDLPVGRIEPAAGWPDLAQASPARGASTKAGSTGHLPS